MEEYGSLNHTERLLLNRKSAALSKYKSNISDFDLGICGTTPKNKKFKSKKQSLKKLLSFKYAKFKGRNSERKIINGKTSISVNRHKSIKSINNGLNSDRKRKSYLSHVSNTGNKMNIYSKINNFDDLYSLLKNYSELKKFQINSICEWVESILIENNDL